MRRRWETSHPFSLSLLIFSLSHFLAFSFSAPPPVLTPVEQQKTFRFAEPGYRIELVASDPMVQDPVAITFDGEGRLWVVEMRGYMPNVNGTGSRKPVGRVSVLEDVNGDGKMDKSTVFADQLVLPRAISLHPDGVLIAQNKALHFYEDTDGDLVQDRKTLVDKKYAHDSIEHSANGLLRAMDNWIYNAKEGHRYRRTTDGWKRDDTEKRGQWGICQDNWGRLFYNYNHSQLHADFVPPNTLTRNPNHEPSTGLGAGVALSNEVFPIRPTRAANRGYIPGALDEEGRIKQFTSACAPMIYRGALFSGFAGNSFVCETVGNLIKRSILSESGVAVTGASAYPDKDFLASTDERFRPCWITEGPDGAIYVTDMYRGIVQDAPHMSPYLREHSIKREMDKPIHLGRIWRIVPEKFEQPKPPGFSNMPEAELVKTLAHPAGWWRDQAQMFLVEKNFQSAIPELRKMALEHDNPLARLHALWTLEGLGDSEPGRLVEALDDDRPMVQTAALRVLVSLGMNHHELLQQISRLSKAAPSDELALQMILTLGDLKVGDDGVFPLLLKLLHPRINNPLMRDAALSSLANRELVFLERAFSHFDDAAQSPGANFLIEMLSQSIVKSRSRKRIETLLAFLDSEDLNWKQKSVLSGIKVQGSGLTRKPVKLSGKPTSAKGIPEFAQYFAWPGHTPEPPKLKIRPLTSAEEKLFTRGRQVYLTSCVACHGNEGKGMKLLAPPLAGSDWVQGSEERLVRVLFHGLTGSITVSGKQYAAPEIQPLMPPLAMLSNGDIAAVLTYIRREWGNASDPISTGDVNQHRIKAQGRTVPWTEAELEQFANLKKEEENEGNSE